MIDCISSVKSLDYRPIPQEVLDRVAYDPSSPSGLKWIKPRWKSWLNKSTGSHLRHNGISYLCWRVVWALHHGEPGDLMIDHIDHDRLNNTIENLRLASNSQNQFNRYNYSAGKYKGVKKHARSERWIATEGGRYLGSFSTPEEAAQAYNQAALQHQGEYAQLNHI